MNIIFLGPPGSGKGTQAKRLADGRGWRHLSTGDMFRDTIKSGSELGLELKAYVETGKLVPDELVSRLVFETLKNFRGASGFVLDGYPRTEDQAKALDLFSKNEKIPIDAAIFFDVAFAELVKRLSARRQCGSCKEVFNLVNKPPKKEGVCDACGNAVTQRPDDRAEIVEERLRIYTRLTEPILAHYQTRPGYIRVDAAQSIDDVNKAIEAGLAKRQAELGVTAR